jgi:hypothetical protein
VWQHLLPEDLPFALSTETGRIPLFCSVALCLIETLRVRVPTTRCLLVPLVFNLFRSRNPRM